jgi:tRNA pseudouridine-54 N-methylase
MFLKGFGYNQCEKDVAKQPSRALGKINAQGKARIKSELIRRALSTTNAKRMLRSNHPGLWVQPMRKGCCEATIQGFEYNQCEKDVAKQPSRALSTTNAKRMLRSNHPGLWVRPMRKGCCEATIQGFEYDQCEEDVAKQPSEALS